MRLEIPKPAVYERWAPWLQAHNRETPYALGQHVDEATYLAQMCAEVQPKVCVEIGVLRGGFAHLVSHVAQVEGFSTELIAVEMDPSRAALAAKGYTEAGLRASVIQGDSRDPLVIAQVKELVSARGGPADLLFIDGDHRYDGVKSDYENYTPLLADGGMVVLDDIDVLVKGHQYDAAFGVSRFWDEVKRMQIPQRTIGEFKLASVLGKRVTDCHSFGVERRASWQYQPAPYDLWGSYDKSKPGLTVGFSCYGEPDEVELSFRMLWHHSRSSPTPIYFFGWINDGAPDGSMQLFDELRFHYKLRLYGRPRGGVQFSNTICACADTEYYVRWEADILTLRDDWWAIVHGMFKQRPELVAVARRDTNRTSCRLMSVSRPVPAPIFLRLNAYREAGMSFDVLDGRYADAGTEFIVKGDEGWLIESKCHTLHPFGAYAPLPLGYDGQVVEHLWHGSRVGREKRGGRDRQQQTKALLSQYRQLTGDEVWL